MKGGQQAAEGFESVETFTVERNDGGQRFAEHRGRLDDELDAMAVAEIVEKDVFVIIADAGGGIER